MPQRMFAFGVTLAISKNKMIVLLKIVSFFFKKAHFNLGYYSLTTARHFIRFLLFILVSAFQKTNDVEMKSKCSLNIFFSTLEYDWHF